MLIVGGDQRTQEACRNGLSRNAIGRDAEAEWQVVTTDSGIEALRLLAVHEIDVLVCDFNVDDMADGELLRHAHARFPETARVVVSESTGLHQLDRVVNYAHQFVKAPCEPAALRDAIARAVVLRATLADEPIAADLTGLAVLPSPPEGFLNVVNVLDSPHSDARDVAKAIERDVALTAKVLQLTNSSFFAPRSRVTSVNQAVVLMGRDVLRSVMLLDTVGRGTADAGPVRQWLVDINQRSWETAALARRLARPSVAEDAFCGALLLECGQLAFAACRPQLFAELIRRAARERRHLDELELEAFGVSHSAVGGYLLSMWGFPGEVVELVAAHADGSVISGTEPDAAEVVRAAHQVVTDNDLDVCATREKVSMHNLSDWGVLNTLAQWKGERHPDRLGRTTAGPSTSMMTAIS